MEIDIIASPGTLREIEDLLIDLFVEHFHDDTQRDYPGF
jgi:hypothetical protein